MTITPILYTKTSLNRDIKDLLNAAIAIQIGRKLIENKGRGECTFSRKARSSTSLISIILDPSGPGFSGTIPPLSPLWNAEVRCSKGWIVVEKSVLTHAPPW
jgi:hypothetical protein